MKKTILTLASTILFCGFAAHAGAPGVVIVKGGLYEQSNPQGRCGASTYGYLISGTYTDSKGEEQSVNACLGAIAVPLGGTLDAGTSNNLLRDAKKVLDNAEGKASTLVFAVEDMEFGVDEGSTLISITPN